MGNRKGGLFFGVIMGTLLGVLFAPRKGKELRTKLKKEIQEGGYGTETLKKNFVEMGHDMAGTAQEIYEQPSVQKTIAKGKKYATKVAKDVQHKIDETQEKVKEMGNEYYAKGREKVGEMREQIEEGLQKAKNHIVGDAAFEKRPISSSKKTSHPRAANTSNANKASSAHSKKMKGRHRKVDIKEE